MFHPLFEVTAAHIVKHILTINTEPAATTDNKTPPRHPLNFLPTYVRSKYAFSFVKSSGRREPDRVTQRFACPNFSLTSFPVKVPNVVARVRKNSIGLIQISKPIAKALSSQLN